MDGPVASVACLVGTGHTVQFQDAVRNRLAVDLDGVAVVRVGDEGPELVMFDVRAGAFFQGALALEPELPEARITRFVLRRARVSARGAPSPAEAAQAQAERPDPLAPTPEEENGEPDFFEQYWPYFVAALLLGGMITAIAVTSSADAPDQPVLRFVPGGR